MAQRAPARGQKSAAGNGMTRRIIDAPRLSRAEEAALHRRWMEDRDPDALRALITGNARIVAKLAAKFAGHVDFEDLFQEGLLGLLESTDRYDPEQGHFGTYGVWAARDRVQAAVLENIHPTRIPSKSPEANALLGAKAPHAPKALLVPALPLDAPIADGEAATFADITPDDRASPEEEFQEAEVEDKRRVLIERALARLDEREADVIRVRHLRVPPLGRREAGLKWGVSDERVRQLEVRALQKLAAVLTEEFGLSRETMLDLLSP